MILKKRLPLILIIFVLTHSLYPQDADDTIQEPAWVLYEKGMREYQKKEYGTALNFFIMAIKKAGVMPEAELAIGDIYMLQGEYAIAENQYKKAVQMENAFLIPEQKYDIYYRLVNLYKNRSNYYDMENYLLLIIQDDERFSSAKYESFKNRLLKSYKEEGFDKLLDLYRLEDSFASLAHRELAYYYYRAGRTGVALNHSLYGIIPIISTAIEEIRKHRPSYIFTTLDDFFEYALNIELIRDYLIEVDFYMHLYFLAQISWDLGYYTQANELWRIIALKNDAGQYSTLARQKIK